MLQPLRLLIVEDSEDDAFFVVEELRTAGYDVTHRRVETPVEMREALKSEAWDLIVSDYVMPQFNALGALAIFEEAGIDVPFLVISGSIAEPLAVMAMRAGVRDYILKDNMTRLAPVVDRELREAAYRRGRKQMEPGRLDELIEQVRKSVGVLLESNAGGESARPELIQIRDAAEAAMKLLKS